LAKKKKKAEVEQVEEESSASINLSKNVLTLNGTEYAVDRDVATFIYDMMMYADNLSEEYAMLASIMTERTNV